jgi:hypothetical protein
VSPLVEFHNPIIIPQIVTNECPLIDDPLDKKIQHANSVTGVLGADNTDNTLDGIAPATQIVSYGSPYSLVSTSECSPLSPWGDSFGDILEVWEGVNDGRFDIRNIDLFNISLGHKIIGVWPMQDCNALANYTQTSFLLDQMVYGKSSNWQPVIITTASGNEKRQLSEYEELCLNPHNDLPSYSVSSPGTAKNPIVAGAIYSIPQERDELILAHSGIGPTDDGRIKPDLVAYGAHNSEQGIYSTWSWDESSGSARYEYSKGTSLAAPQIGGVVLLMKEQWRNQEREFLFPHTAKAILIHTADDLGNSGPDFTYGWGKINPKNAIDLVRDSPFINAKEGNEVSLRDSDVIIFDSISGQSGDKLYELPIEFTTDLKVTLVWDDLEGDVSQDSSAPVLVNDLDVMVTGSGINLQPISPSKSNPNSEAFPQDDNINNVEMMKGQIYENAVISVKIGERFFSDEQDYTLIVSKARSENQTTLISINDVSILEGNDGQINLDFDVIRSGDTTSSSIVTYTTIALTAIEGVDYALTEGTLNFDQGVSRQQIRVPIFGDTDIEGDKEFIVRLTSCEECIFLDDEGLGTIRNDDETDNDADDDGFPVGIDCNDADPAINPNANEVCDFIDNNCDGKIDEGLTNTFFQDSDEDSYGSVNSSITTCSAPDGYVTNNSDCNDADPAINPNANEVCDNLDNNCSGQIDENLSTTIYYHDNDSDGFGNANSSINSCSEQEGYVTNGSDCDDSNNVINPNAIEIKDDKDNDCDGQIDEGLGGGCLIATATFGSELAPQVQELRELRDNIILSTDFGVGFMNKFNKFYYSFSPTIADFERANPVFKESVKMTITPMIYSLSILNYAEIDSEEEILGYLIGAVLLNVGMYLGLPIFLTLKLKNHFKK